MRTCGKATRYLAIRVTDTERSLIAAKVENTGLSLQSYITLSALNDPCNLSRTLPEIKRVAVPVVAHLKRCGNNINQLAKTRNSGKSVGKQDICGAVRWLVSILLHLMPKDELIDIVQTTEPCKLDEEAPCEHQE